MLGISKDSEAANAAFAQKYQLPYSLLSDETGEVCLAYGACDDLSAGRVRRNTYVIGPDGTILRLFRDVNPKDQAEMVLAFLRKPSNQLNQEGTPAEQLYGDENVDENSTSTELKREKNMEAKESELNNGQLNAGNEPQKTPVGQELASSVDTKEQPNYEQGVAVSPSSMTKPDALKATDEQHLAPSQVQPSQDGPTLVFALGTLGYDFGSEARRDSLMQHMGESDLLSYLDENPSQAAAVIWTLNLDATPIYAAQPQGPFASAVYDRLRQFLKEQAEEGVERVSIPGVIFGQVTLLSGQVVPAILPEPRCMYSWNTAALVEAICGKPPAKSAKAKEREAYNKKAEAVTSFLERIYHELRNLGMTSQERAVNYSAANVANAKNVFESALKKNLELHSIDVEPSPICRPGSDCWDVKLVFFDPENVLRAKTVYRFTVDVSDVCPVMVGSIRTWSVS